MSGNYGFEPTLDGLNNIDADNTTTSDIVCNTIQILNSGTSPTMIAGDNTTHIATTAFVTNAVAGAGAGYVLLTGNQTLTTGIKTFTNLPECSAVPTTANQLVNKTYVDSGLFVNLTTNQSVGGAKTFTSNIIAGSGTLQSPSGTDLLINTLGAGDDVTIQASSQKFITEGCDWIYSYAGEKFKIGYAVDTGYIKIKTAFDNFEFRDSAGASTMNFHDYAATGGYKTGDITIADTQNFNLIPAGTIITRAVSGSVSGYLLCNGASYSTASGSSNPYLQLYLTIGYTFGGSGALFKVPNYEGAFLRGQGSQTAGSPAITYTSAAVGVIQQDQVLSATYATSNGYHNLASGGTGKQCPSRTQITTDPIDTSSFLAQFARQGTENRPMNYCVYYFIKY